VGTASGTPADDAVDADPARHGGLGRALDLLEDGPHPRRAPQVIGNLILTSHAGLIVLFALVLLYLSGLAFTPLRPVHFALGFALIPILVVKLASTAWRAIATSFTATRTEPRAALVAAAGDRAAAGARGGAGHRQRRGALERGHRPRTWAAIHTDSVIALAVIVLVHVAVYLRKALRASAKSLAATAINRRNG